jgi:uncharacterized membrane protein
MKLSKHLNLIKENSHKFALATLFLAAILTFAYSIVLSLKRYQNYEYGKFDLGNMSQMVWNSAHGDFMVVTDQFGSNMPRWGMSHVDPVLLIFVPIYWIYAHPMIMVFVQQFVVISAAFAIYYLSKLKTKNVFVSWLTALSYLFYPAIGYTLIWTTYHGVSFVAPLLIWLVLFLEKKNYLVNTLKWNKILYWFLLSFILLGKEQIGIMLALGSIFLYKKNKQLAIQTFIVSIVWFIIAFFIIIPHYAPLREQSINSFVNLLNVSPAESENVQGENFFLVRYEELGDSYSDIIINMILKPGFVFKSIYGNLNVVNDLIGPLGFIVVLNPIWLITSPDLAILILSNEQIFGIDNHRVAIIISALFLSYIYLLAYGYKKKYKEKFIIAFSVVVLALNIFYSYKTHNPLFVSVTSFVKEKVINKVFAYQIGEASKIKAPRNDLRCLNYVRDYVLEKNPQIYTGPDYLGAHMSNRYVNALFPGRITDADIIVADLFDEKALNRVGVDYWFTNKVALEKIVSQKYEHKFSCGMLNIFEKPSNLDEAKVSGKVILNEKPFIKGTYDLNTSRTEMKFYPTEIPTKVKINEPSTYKIEIVKVKGNIGDSVNFWRFENSQDSSVDYSFLDYVTAAYSVELEEVLFEEGKSFNEEINITIPGYVKPGTYKVFYGVGDLVRATQIYIGEVVIE